MSTSMPDPRTGGMSTSAHLTITQAVTSGGHYFLEDPVLAVNLPIAYAAGDEGTLLIALGVDRGDHDEVRLNPGLDSASSVTVIVRAIELLEQLRDELRAAGQS